MKFLDWINENALILKLEITKFDWPEKILANLIDIQVKIVIDGQGLLGRGRCTSYDNSLIKALAEAVERAFFIQSTEQTSNGFAVHTNKQKAKKNALFELAERDLFLCHYLTKSKIQNITERVTKQQNSPEILEAKNNLKNHGVELVVGKFRSDNSISGNICLAFGSKFAAKPFGVCIGLGCSDDEESSIRQSLFECLTATSYYLFANSEDSISPLTDLAENPKQRSTHSHRLSGYHQSQAKLFRYMLSENAPERSSSTNELDNFLGMTKFIEFDSKGILEGVPLFAYKAHNPNLQDLYFGNTRVEKVNLARLESFVGKKIEFTEINQFLHPIE